MKCARNACIRFQQKLSLHFQQKLSLRFQQKLSLHFQQKLSLPLSPRNACCTSTKTVIATFTKKCMLHFNKNCHCTSTKTVIATFTKKCMLHFNKNCHCHFHAKFHQNSVGTSFLPSLSLSDVLGGRKDFLLHYVHTLCLDGTCTSRTVIALSTELSFALSLSLHFQQKLSLSLPPRNACQVPSGRFVLSNCQREYFMMKLSRLMLLFHEITCKISSAIFRQHSAFGIR
jgi:hypothetical protein